MYCPRTARPALVPPTGTPAAMRALIAARNEDGFSVIDDVGDLGIGSGIAVRDDERGDRARLAQIVDVGVVSVVASGTQDEEVATATFCAEPLESFIEIGSTSEQGIARSRRGRDILLVANADVLEGGSLSRR